MPEHTIPESLVDAIKSGRAALVVGAGVGVPSWKQLLEQMNERLASRGEDGDEAATKDVAKLLHKGSLARAAGFLARTLGQEICDEIVKQAWATPDELPDVSKALARLPFRHIWTTFPGDVLDRAIADELPEGWPNAEILTYEHAAEISRRRRTLIKFFGDFDSYVVTPASLRQALSKATELREYAREFYADGALIFVGFRFGDPDLSALLDRVFGLFDLPQSNHYLVASGLGPVTVDELRHEHHIEVVNLAGKGADETATQALVEYLDELHTVCTEAQITLSQAHPEDDDLDGWLAVWDDDPVAAQEAIAHMEALAREAGESDKLVDILVARIEREEDAAERAALLRSLAHVFENEIGDLPQAFTALTAAIREYPSDTTAVDEAERLAADVGGWTELATDVTEVAGEIEDKRVAALYLTRLGHWYERHLDHVDYAVMSFRQALKLDAEAVAAYAGLAELYRKSQRWSELADVLAEHVEVERDTESKVDLYLALGDLCETQLASTARAIEAYQASADLDRDNDDALAALERLYRRDERWGKLAETLERRAQRLDEIDSHRASAMRRELATLRAEKLGDVEGAIGKYEAALEADESDVEALRALVGLYEKTGRTDDYLRTLERLVDASPESEQPTLLLRVAAEIEDRDSAKAAECYVRITDIESSGPAAQDAYRALARLLRKDGEWYDLITTYERHIEIVDDAGERAELHASMAEVFEDKLDDPHRALEAHLSIVELEEANKDSLAAAARLYERTESWDRAIETLVKHAELEGKGGAALWHRAGALITDHLDELGDDQAAVAEKFLEKALELDPGHRDAMLVLASLHKRRSSWANAVDFLTRAEEQTQNRLEQVELLAEAAELTEDKLADPERALTMLLRVLELDPEKVDAGERASERLIQEGRWREAIPILDMLARKSDDKLARARNQRTLGHGYETLDDFDKAAEHYQLAVEADPGDLDAALGLGNALYVAAEARLAAAQDGDDDGEDAAEAESDDARLDRWRQIDSRYRDTLARHRAGLADSKVVEIWYRLGVAATQLDSESKADSAYRRALELDPMHKLALDGLVGVATARADWKTVIESKRALIETLGGDDAEHGKIGLLGEIGDTYQKQLSDPTSALGSYLEALQLQPDSHITLHKVLDIYTAQSEWRRAVETLSTLADHETSDRRRSKYRYAAAVIARDELEDTPLAVDQFNLVLDADPDSRKSFDAVVKLLEDEGDYKNLARAYRKMLKRAGEQAPLDTLLPLWTRLGEIYAEHLGDHEAAIAALEVASSLQPDDMARHEQLANLYLEVGESRRLEAIAELQVLIQGDPDRPELYRALSTLYTEVGEIDKAYCLARALILLGAADDDERALADRHQPHEFIAAKRRLTEEQWRKFIAHPDEDRRLSAMFATLCGPIAAITAQPPGAFNLREEDRSDIGKDSPMVVARVFKYASDILGVDPQPSLYLRHEDEGIRVANTREGQKLVPSVLVGKPHTRNKDESVLAFEVGKRLAYFRPERYVHYALQTVPKLENAYVAALVATGQSDTKLDEDAGKIATHLRKTVSGAVLEQVAQVARKLDESAANGKIPTWHSAADLTANRIGLILCNDLTIAARIIATETAAMSTLSAKQRLRDLLAYSVSESYFAVRRHLGLEVTERGD